MLSLIFAVNLLYLTDDKNSLVIGNQYINHCAPICKTITSRHISSAKDTTQQLVTDGVLQLLIKEKSPDIVVNNTLQKVDHPNVLDVTPLSKRIETFGPRLIEKLRSMEVKYSTIVLLTNKTERSDKTAKLFASQLSGSQTISVGNTEELKTRISELLMKSGIVIVNLMTDSDVPREQYDHILVTYNNKFVDVGFGIRQESEAIVFDVDRSSYLKALTDKKAGMKYRVKMNVSRLKSLGVRPKFSTYEGVI